ncbi:MAG: xanthine dehydrogenase family protein molybdopterin-binding subunit [Cyclobacteriaceae bacterium]|nr:xanthine dehydrogenase family protein molybdopterin-binding subunit [Cyclobacteriaceae bacterium]
MATRNYLKIDFKDIKTYVNPGRRKFLKRLGGGILIICSVGDFSSLHAEILQSRPMPTDLNVYLRIREDGKVELYTGKIEMGQGVNTSLAQMLAEELDVNLDDVVMIMGDTDLCPWDMGTFGSMTTRFFGPPLRAAGAEARAVLLKLASEKLKVPLERLVVYEGMVQDRENKEIKVSYASLTKGQQIVEKLKDKPPLKKPEDFRIIGKPVFRQDSTLKVTGEALYAGDIRLPGMLSARILRPPAHGAGLLGLDTSALESFGDVVVVNEKDLFAVLHPNPERAHQALSRVKAEWKVPDPEVNDRTIFEYLVNKAGEGSTVDREGDLTTGMNASSEVVEEKYLNAYVAHAPMEPHAATAEFENGKLRIWASTQTPFRLQETAAGLLDLPVESVRVMQNFVGGGFGGKSNNQQALEAARLARITGKPVQLIWTRKEEFFYDTFRPAAVVKIRSGLDNEGRISFWDYKVYAAGERGSRHFYDIPHHQTVAYGEWGGSSGIHPFAVGPWRAPANNTNTFARESHIDMLAHKAGMDPFDFRLKNLKDPKMIRVLEAVGGKFGYRPDRFPSRRGFGMACGIDAGTYVALMAEVEVDQSTGKIKVRRVACAQDMGLVINPQGALIQMEGCIIMGLGYALSEEIRFDGGKIHNQNFDDYEFTKFSWIPEIQPVFIDAPEEPAQGGGEPSIICMGAVIANAVFDAVGSRIFQLPLTPERVLAAMNG